ncbi:MAG: hypothetical protein KIT84_26035 [Labilithrix sp.]|nr:hypothetical protein [Labilithrix sp.]MCW5814515.1 hypothetical protein [Labilithrix sp.]
MRAAAAAVFFVLALGAGPASASSALDLVQIARSYEASHQDDLALRRYMDALSLDPSCAEAYLGLGSLRARRGDLHEAERVYTVALDRLPQLRAARVARAMVRRGLRATNEAIEDLVAGAEDEVAAWKQVAAWYGEDGLAPAQLAIWRRLLARAEATNDAALAREARLMVRALVIIVGPADPALSLQRRGFAPAPRSQP